MRQFLVFAVAQAIPSVAFQSPSGTPFLTSLSQTASLAVGSAGCDLSSAAPIGCSFCGTLSVWRFEGGGSFSVTDSVFQSGLAVDGPGGVVFVSNGGSVAFLRCGGVDCTAKEGAFASITSASISFENCHFVRCSPSVRPAERDCLQLSAVARLRLRLSAVNFTDNSVIGAGAAFSAVIGVELSMKLVLANHFGGAGIVSLDGNGAKFWLNGLHLVGTRAEGDPRPLTTLSVLPEISIAV
jgi:hypothetical protein